MTSWRPDPRVPVGTLTEPASPALSAIGQRRRTATCSSVCEPVSSLPAKRVLRARIDMASPNINLRDPILDRIVHADPPRQPRMPGGLPPYDFAHGQSNAIEGITHSICTLEFEKRLAAVRLVDRSSAGTLAAAPVNESRASTYLDGALQALPAALGAGGPRARLGRSAHANHRRHASPRLPRQGLRDFAAAIGVSKAI